MSSFHLTVGDNIRALSDWHKATHPLTKWTDCPFEPCRCLEQGFRKAWTQ